MTEKAILTDADFEFIRVRRERGLGWREIARRFNTPKLHHVTLLRRYRDWKAEQDQLKAAECHFEEPQHKGIIRRILDAIFG
jgi:transcriptional regulator